MKLTANMKEFLKQDAKEHYNTARNCHIWALGSSDDKEACELEVIADEHRALAQLLEKLAKKDEI